MRKATRWELIALFLILHVMMSLDYALGEVTNVLNFQADIIVPMASGGDLPPDSSYDIYRRVWRASQTEIENLERQSLDFFREMTDLDIAGLPACALGGGLFSNIPAFKSPFKAFQAPEAEEASGLCLLRSMEGVTYAYDQGAQKRVASIYHVRNLDIVGYKLVQSLKPEHDATESPLPMFDTGFVLNVLESGYFPCSKFQGSCTRGDRLLFGWYTIRDIYNKGEWGVIHYQSRGPQNILGEFTPLSFNLSSPVWGKGYSNGFVSRRYVNNDYVQPCHENACPYRMSKMFDTVSVSFRNVLTFITA
ncbi:putative signal peptide protein [Cryptosporidium canis]|uniref:Signal peptide protein n=1 Tax=Cryptosporidium canis TaxID=195482 RepID=A0A9D5HYG6_9CRYT|nr:putative signal peptide protein [Cryptosporidium canis]